MKISKVKLIIPLMLVMVTLVCQPAIWAGEHPWDGDSSPAGGQNPGGSGGGNGGSGDDDSTLQPMTKLTSPRGGTGVNIQIYIQGVFFRFATSVYSNLVAKDTKLTPISEKQVVRSTAISGDAK